jgi:hypothetical protein
MRSLASVEGAEEDVDAHLVGLAGALGPMHRRAYSGPS